MCNCSEEQVRHFCKKIIHQVGYTDANAATKDSITVGYLYEI